MQSDYIFACVSYFAGLVFSSGLAATMNVISMLDNGDKIICMDDVYGGTGRLFRQMIKGANKKVDFVDLTDIGKLEKALTTEVKVNPRSFKFRDTKKVYGNSCLMYSTACMDRDPN